MKLFAKMRERLEKAAPVENWTGNMNYPFYGYLDKPRPSLSKHEGTERGQSMLHLDDLTWIVTARRDMPKLLEALDIAIDALKQLEIKVDWIQDDLDNSEFKEMESLIDNALKKIESINEEK